MEITCFTYNGDDVHCKTVNLYTTFQFTVDAFIFMGVNFRGIPLNYTPFTWVFKILES